VRGEQRCGGGHQRIEHVGEAGLGGVDAGAVEHATILHDGGRDLGPAEVDPEGDHRPCPAGARSLS
jgi:hypothetical protein